MKNLLSTENLNWIKSLSAVMVIVSVTIVFAGDFRWVSHDKFDLAMSEQSNSLTYLEIRSLRREISFLDTKVRENEATNSERIILPELKRQLKDLEDAVD